MSINFQTINESLARGGSQQDELKNEINKADKYLKCGEGDKPDWLDGFFKSNENKLKETILRATSLPEGISSLSGYNEGYFNEIIQNANDLHAGDTIKISVSKNGAIYSVECRYRDKGFVLSNIYGFLNREMSDKSSDEGQTGKFGIGIKSFFKFVRKFRIESNVIFDYIINREGEQSTVESQVSVNEHWDKQNTLLYFEYDEEEAVKSGFNIKKLSDFITLLDNKTENLDEKEIRKFFISGKDEDIIFDIRSMIFMKGNTKKDDKEKENNEKDWIIKQLQFIGGSHKVTIVCNDLSYNKTQEFNYNKERWSVRKVGLDIFVDKDPDNENRNGDSNKPESEYIVFKQADISIGIPLSDEPEEEYNNRFYATYYIKSDISRRFFPTGMIIDSPFANIHRNDLGDSEKTIEAAYQKIQDSIINVFQCMCSREILSVQYLDDISNAFHYIIFKYLNADRERYQESPLNIGLDNQYLSKISGCTKSDIVVHQNVENYQKSTPLDSDSVHALTDLYFECIEKNNVIDYNELVEPKKCLAGVSLVYEKIASCSKSEAYCSISENYRIARKILHFFSDVAEYITYKISGERREESTLTDSEIDYWLIHLKEEMGERYKQALCLKLIGRYELNSALAFDGSLIKERLSFKNYLFNGIPELENGALSNWENEQYDSKYFNLKQELLGNRFFDKDNKKHTYMIRYMEPLGASHRGWNGKYDCYRLDRMICDVSETNKYILLKKIALDSEMSDSINIYMFKMCLFEKRPIQLQLREKFFVHYKVYEQQIVCLDFLKSIKLVNYGEFLQAVDYRKRIKEHFGDVNIKISCYQPKLFSLDIVNMFLPELVKHNENTKKSYLISEYSPDDVEIEEIQENTNNELPQENIDFIINISGYKIHVSRFDSGSKKYVIAYFGNRTAEIKMDASTPFKPIAKYNSVRKDIYVFYDNVPDINIVVSSVLKELKLSNYLMELLLGYIHNGNNTKTMNYLSRRRSFARVKKKLILDWAVFSSDEVPDIENIEILYRILTSRGSYDIYCPICADIPLETFDYGEDTKKKHSRKIMVLENENPDTRKEYPYVITVACSYCFEKLRHTLCKSEFDGKRLTLTTQIAQGQHEKMKSRHQLELSPVNIMIMKNVKFGNKNS